MKVYSSKDSFSLPKHETYAAVVSKVLQNIGLFRKGVLKKL